MRLFNFRYIASVGSKFILWNLEGFDKRCMSCWMYSFLSIITNVLFLSAFRMMMLSFLLNSLILTNQIELKQFLNSFCLNSFCLILIKYEQIQDWSHQSKFFLHRAYNICSDYTSLTTEIARIKQLVINNNFPNYLVDQVTKEFINKKQDNKLHAQNKRDTANTEQQTNQVEFYYRNQITSNYRQVEKELTAIINSSIETTNEAKLKLNIYYKSRKVKNLFIRNNSNKPDQPFNVVYQYTCNQGECTTSQSTYIGHTRTTIKDRFKQHVRSDQETSPTNPQQQHHRIPNAPKRDNTGNRAQQARPSNTGSTSDQATWTENQ